MRHHEIQKIVNECHELGGRRHEDGVDTLEIVSGKSTVSIYIPWETSPVGWVCERDHENLLAFRNLRTTVTINPADVEEVKTTASGSSYPWTLRFFMKEKEKQPGKYRYIPCQDDEHAQRPPQCNLCAIAGICDYDLATEEIPYEGEDHD